METPRKPLGVEWEFYAEHLFLVVSNFSASAAARFAVFSFGPRMPGFSIRFAACSSW